MNLNGYESMVSLNKSVIALLDSEIAILNNLPYVQRTEEIRNRITDLESRKADLQNHIEKDEKIIKAVKNYKENILKVRKVRDLVPRDIYESREKTEEINRREAEIMRDRKLLTPSLFTEAQDEIKAIVEEEEREASRSTETQTPVENSEEQTPVENSEEQTPVENSEEQTPVENSEEQTPVENSEEQTPVENSEEQTPVENSEEDDLTQIPVQETPKSLMRILSNLQTGLTLKPKTGKKYLASNIQVKEQFKTDLKSGNVLYNVVHFIPATVKAVTSGFKKMVSKISYRKKAKDDVNTLKERINSLSPTDLEVIFTQYKGSRIMQESMPSVVNILLQEKVREYVLGKVQVSTDFITEGYNKIITDAKRLKEITEELEVENISIEQEIQLNIEKNNLLFGKADLIKNIRDKYNESNNLLNGGLHGFDEDIKAATTKLSYVGKRFAKMHANDEELLNRQALLEEMEINAIENGDNAQAMDAFMKSITLLSEETTIKKSLWGHRKAGKKYFMPIPGELNYNNDPFLRDLISSVAIVSTAINVVDTIHTTTTVQNAVNTHNAQVTSVNASNASTMQTVNDAGTQITGQTDTFIEGMNAQNQATMSIFEPVYTKDLSAANGSHYIEGSGTYVDSSVSAVGHEMTNSLYATTQANIQKVATDYANGTISKIDVLSEYSKMASESNTVLNDLLVDYQPAMEEFAAANPGFDYTGLSGAVDYLVSNPTAISDMNSGIVDVVNIGDSLSSLSVQSLQLISELPNSLKTTLLSAIAATALVTNVSNTMNNNVKSRKYGNSVTELVKNYLSPEEVVDAEVVEEAPAVRR